MNLFIRLMTGCCLLLSFNVHAEETKSNDLDDVTYYIILGAPDRPYDHAPYKWMTHDRMVLFKGISTDEGRAYIKQASGVSQYFLVFWNGVQQSYTIKQACWEMPQQQFEQCIKLDAVGYTPEYIAEQKKREEEEKARREKRLKRATWVFDDIAPADVKPLIDNAIHSHKEWLERNQDKINAQIASKTFACKELSAEVVARMQILGPNQRGYLDENVDQISAAKSGNWVAASNIATKMIYYHDDWEGASAVIAWMVKQEVPAAYDRLADLVSATSSYEHGRSSKETKEFITGLRWHSAMLGSYVGQENLSDLMLEQGHDALGFTAMDCARKQRTKHGR